MSRTPLRDRVLPAYSKKEECANMITHIVGGGIGVVVLLWAVLLSCFRHNVWGIVSGAVYGASMLCLYAVSSVYHGLRPCRGKKVMQVIDHCTIYFLIAGTYTPILLCAIRPAHPAAAWTVFGVEWGLALGAAAFTAIDLKKYKVLSMACYIGLGWCVLGILRPTIEALGVAGFAWLLAGGVSYTVGALLYGVGKKKPIFHTVFHIFVDVGSVLQAVCILGYVL
ncbi:MAG: hemolysin III family protein [Clostridia bacterium]|nr:hemolysin III family protein [Clostridia bacterium]